MVLKHDNMISSHFSKIQIKTIPVKLAKIQTLTIPSVDEAVEKKALILTGESTKWNHLCRKKFGKSIKITYVFPL